MNIDTLTQKLGPLPVWAWGVGAGAVIIGGRRLLSARTGAAIAAATVTAAATGAPPSPVAAAGPPASFGVPSFSAGSGYQPAPTAADTSTPAPASNDGWQSDAVRMLIAGGASPLLAQQAIGAYLTGDAITPAQRALIEQAIRTVGMPPAAVPPITLVGGTGAGGSIPTPGQTEPAPTAAPWAPPAWLNGAKVVTGSGPAVSLVRPDVIDGIPSESAFVNIGGSFNPPNWTDVPDSVLSTFPRLGVLPTKQQDPSLP